MLHTILQSIEAIQTNSPQLFIIILLSFLTGTLKSLFHGKGEARVRVELGTSFVEVVQTSTGVDTLDMASVDVAMVADSRNGIDQHVLVARSKEEGSGHLGSGGGINAILLGVLDSIDDPVGKVREGRVTLSRNKSKRVLRNSLAGDGVASDLDIFLLDCAGSHDVALSCLELLDGDNWIWVNL